MKLYLDRCEYSSDAEAQAVYATPFDGIDRAQGGDIVEAYTTGSHGFKVPGTRRTFTTPGTFRTDTAVALDVIYMAIGGGGGGGGMGGETSRHGGLYTPGNWGSGGGGAGGGQVTYGTKRIERDILERILAIGAKGTGGNKGALDSNGTPGTAGTGTSSTIASAAGGNPGLGGVPGPLSGPDDPAPSDLPGGAGGGGSSSNDGGRGHSSYPYSTPGVDGGNGPAHDPPFDAAVLNAPGGPGGKNYTPATTYYGRGGGGGTNPNVSTGPGENGNDGTDGAFIIWYGTLPTIDITKSTNSYAGTYSLKLVTNLNAANPRGDVTRTWVDPATAPDLTGATAGTCYVACSKTGPRFKLSFEFLSGVIASNIITIAVADTYQLASVDLSTLTDAEKASLRKITLTCIDDLTYEEMTYYIDDLAATGPLLVGRIAWPFPPSDKYSETIRFTTAIHVSDGGYETRMAMTTDPRRATAITSQLVGRRSSQFAASIGRAAVNRAIFSPLWFSLEHLTGSVSVGAQIIPCTGAIHTGANTFYLLLWRDALNWEVMIIDTIGSSSVHITEPVTLAYTTSDLVIPCFPATIQADLSIARSGVPYIPALSAKLEDLR